MRTIGLIEKKKSKDKKNNNEKKDSKDKEEVSKGGKIQK